MSRSITATRKWIESKFKYTDFTDEELVRQARIANIDILELIGVLRLRYKVLIEKYKRMV